MRLWSASKPEVIRKKAMVNLFDTTVLNISSTTSLLELTAEAHYRRFCQRPSQEDTFSRIHSRLRASHCNHSCRVSLATSTCACNTNGVLRSHDGHAKQVTRHATKPTGFVLWCQRSSVNFSTEKNDDGGKKTLFVIKWTSMILS